MYYYVLAAIQSRAERQHHQRLRDVLTRLGIAGELAQASPARSAAEQAYIGTTKGYSTIVAVGNDAHINQVAMAVAGRAVLGIIPIEASREVTELIGTDDVTVAAEALKFRRLSWQDTVLINDEIPLFLTAQLETAQLAKVNLIIDNRVRVNAYFNRLTINRSLELNIKSQYLSERKKVLGLFNVGGQVMESSSFFHGHNVRLVTEPALSLKVAGQTIVKTPAQFKLLPKSLKLITKRGTVLE